MVGMLGFYPKGIQQEKSFFPLLLRKLSAIEAIYFSLSDSSSDGGT